MILYLIMGTLKSVLDKVDCVAKLGLCPLPPFCLEKKKWGGIRYFPKVLSSLGSINYIYEAFRFVSSSYGFDLNYLSYIVSQTS